MTDLSSRINIDRLYLLVRALMSSVTALQQTQIRASGIGVYDTYTAFSTADGSQLDAVMIKRDIAGQFGIFFPETTTQPVDNRSVVQDATGRTFVRFE